MNLNKEDLVFLCQMAQEAAKKAGDVINSYAEKDITLSYKDSGHSAASQIVTEVDHHCEEVIVKHLGPSILKYDLALLTEEQEDDKLRLQKDYFWCIDPLDGTLAFAESKAGYAVSIALVSRSGIPIIGVVFDPLNDTLYSAIKGQGAKRNNKEWHVPNPCSSGQITIPLDRSLLARKDINTIRKALNSALHSKGYDQIIERHDGGAVMNACWALEKSPSCYFKLPKPQEGGGSIWDFAATSCLYHELNMPVYDFFGNKLKLNSPQTTFMNKYGVIFASSSELAILIRSLIHTEKDSE